MSTIIKDHRNGKDIDLARDVCRVGYCNVCHTVTEVVQPYGDYLCLSCLRAAVAALLPEPANQLNALKIAYADAMTKLVDARKALQAGTCRVPDKVYRSLLESSDTATAKLDAAETALRAALGKGEK